MRKLLLFVPLFVPQLAAADPPAAADEPVAGRPVHTYSIVARDPKTGDLGVAVQSHWFAVGPLVAWAEPGVGAIATQSFVDPSYGKLGLDLLRAGKSAPDALAGLITADGKRDVRQVAMIDAQGRVAAHTGAKCIAAAGHQTGEGYSVQANIMASDKVWPAMAAAFEKAEGDLAERLLVALEAAEKAGGDARGRQSAAIVVVSGKATGKTWERIIDVRVDDDAKPLEELRRLVKLNRAYNHMNAGDLAVEHKDMDKAGREYEAAAKMEPTIPELPYWHAVALAATGAIDKALPIFKKVFAADPRWVEITRRLIDPGILPNDPKLLEKILSQAKQKK